MPKIAISTDSTAAISQQEAKELGIYVLPLNVIVDDQEYHDGVDINQQQLAIYMKEGKMIKTSTPTLYEMETFFNKIFEDCYDEIIHLTISSKLTSIFEMFTVGCKERYGDKVTIIDSLGACSYMGNQVHHALRLVQEGHARDEVIASIKKRVSIENVYFIPETLTYLKRGGRISPAAATIGNMLGIKPVLKFIDGAIEKFGTTRAIKQIIPEIIKDYRSKNYDFNDYEIHIVEFDCDAATRIMREVFKNEFPQAIIKVTPIAINVCAHTGPGTIGIGVTLKP
ncbi:MAG: DegV family protein [Bacilli bacterium]